MCVSPAEQVADIAKVAPPITVSGMTLAGYPLSDWVLVLTALYTVVQLVAVVTRIARSRKATPSGCAVDDCPARKP